MSDVVLHHGDCMEVMRGMGAGSVDAVVTDPPYGLAFMGKEWDHGVPGEAVWREVIRVLKPGGHLLAFGGTRTAHRMVCAIEDAGFEVRDTLMWVYGTGFPKSHNVALAIDKESGAVGPLARAFNFKGGGERSEEFAQNGRDQTVRHVPATPEAAEWQGWGTALKPAYEPIVLARKPLEGTVAANVLRHGTGAINVDACRVATNENRARNNNARRQESGTSYVIQREAKFIDPGGNGRWPANLIHDGSDEVVGLFPVTGPAKASMRGDRSGVNTDFGGPDGFRGHNDNGGSAARFFFSTAESNAERPDESARASRLHYCAKAGKADRAGSKHPTVKPVSLMRYLCRLVTPPSGVVLDPFAGSGTTGQAARDEGFAAVLIEREAEYAADIRRRLAQRQPTSPAPAPVQEALML